MSDLDLLHFPSGRSVGNCRKDAKRLSREKQIPLSQAQDIVAQENGIALPWAKAIATIQANPPAKSHAGGSRMMPADIQAVMDRYPELTHYGMGVPTRGVTSAAELTELYARERARLLAAGEECNKALRYLTHTTKRKTLNTKRSSYGLKHRVEYYMKHLPEVKNYYVANGAFICAAIHAGFEVRPTRHGSPNVHINISEKSPIILWERLTERRPYFSKEVEQLASLRELVGVEPDHEKVNW